MIYKLRGGREGGDTDSLRYTNLYTSLINTSPKHTYIGHSLLNLGLPIIKTHDDIRSTLIEDIRSTLIEDSSKHQFTVYPSDTCIMYRI